MQQVYLTFNYWLQWRYHRLASRDISQTETCDHLVINFVKFTVVLTVFTENRMIISRGWNFSNISSSHSRSISVSRMFF